MVAKIDVVGPFDKGFSPVSWSIASETDTATIMLLGKIVR